MKNLKMYILIRDSIPMGFALTAAAHASLAAYLRFQHDDLVRQWISGPFRKVICKVSDAEFERAKSHSRHVVLTESALDGRETAIAFKPREDWPRFFQFLKLYRN